MGQHFRVLMRKSTSAKLRNSGASEALSHMEQMQSCKSEMDIVINTLT